MSIRDGAMQEEKRRARGGGCGPFPVSQRLCSCYHAHQSAIEPDQVVHLECISDNRADPLLQINKRIHSTPEERRKKIRGG